MIAVRTGAVSVAQTGSACSRVCTCSGARSSMTPCSALTIGCRLATGSPATAPALAATITAASPAPSPWADQLPPAALPMQYAAARPSRLSTA